MVAFKKLMKAASVVALAATVVTREPVAAIATVVLAAITFGMEIFEVK